MPRSGAGRPPHEPTEETRKLVEALTACGIKVDECAKLVDVTPKTLRKHYRRELDLGVARANAKVAQSLFQMATSGKNAAAAIFWLKVRGGGVWRESPAKVEVSGPGGAPVPVQATLTELVHEVVPSRGPTDP